MDASAIANQPANQAASPVKVLPSPALDLRAGLAATLVTILILSGCEKPLVQVVPAKAGLVESTATSVEAGEVKALRDSVLSAPVSGRIVEVYHQEGERVEAEETLIRLENDLQRITLEEAKIELERLRSLSPSGAASREVLDRAQFAMERARVQYEQTFVRAPFAGLLVELNANLGEMSYGTMPLNLVMGGVKGNTQQTLARVIDDSKIYVEADIDEADAGRLRPGQPARITVEALEGTVLEGRLTRISHTVSTAEGRSRTVRVDIEIQEGVQRSLPDNGDPPRSGLLVGMSADIEVILDKVKAAVCVPTVVVLEGQEEKSVFVVEEGSLKRRRVKVGISNWDLTEIQEGLQAGELVVIPTDRRKLIEGREVRTEMRE
jgi:HlyD family secretion protein